MHGDVPLYGLRLQLQHEPMSCREKAVQADARVAPWPQSGLRTLSWRLARRPVPSHELRPDTLHVPQYVTWHVAGAAVRAARLCAAGVVKARAKLRHELRYEPWRVQRFEPRCVVTDIMSLFKSHVWASF